MDGLDVVIVEDNRNDVEMILDALQDAKINIRSQILKDGAEAVDYFFNPAKEFVREKHQPPRLVMLDLKLPKINGLEVLKKLKSSESTKDIPVVVFTSSNEVRDRMQSYALGVNSYLLKPSDADEFARYIERIMEYWVIMNVKAR
ncbi:MAG TPA: response regulator [Smithellaceae bacterium]|nr:response regulator [Smithellaceae bacterium]